MHRQSTVLNFGQGTQAPPSSVPPRGSPLCAHHSTQHQGLSYSAASPRSRSLPAVAATPLSPGVFQTIEMIETGTPTFLRRLRMAHHPVI